jgi:FimV-like protein
MENRKKGVIQVHKWIGLILIIISTQVVAADGNEPKIVYVKDSKSLWSVALSVKPPGVRVWQAVMALYERNPDAFYDNDVNKLKDNVTLVVPSSKVMLSLTEAEALVRFQLLGDELQPILDKVTLDASSKASVAPKVELANDESVSMPNLLTQDNAQEATENKVQHLTTLNEKEETLVEKSCVSLICNPKGVSVVDEGGSNIGDFYVSIGANILNDYTQKSYNSTVGTVLSSAYGKAGLEANVGYLWRDGIVLELGYQQSNSLFYRADNIGAQYLSLDRTAQTSRKTESILPKVLFVKDVGKEMALYSGLGMGWYKDTFSFKDYANNPYVAKTYGNLYQVFLGSKINLTEDVFVDIRVQKKHYGPSTYSNTDTRMKEYETVDTVLSVGRKL